MKSAFERLTKYYGHPVVRAYLPNQRGSAFKVRLVANLIRGVSIEEAIARLTLSNKRAAKYLLKLLNQAIANAVNNHALTASELFIFRIAVNEARTLKRSITVPRGSSHPIRKRSCHIEILLAEKDQVEALKREKNGDKFAKEDQLYFQQQNQASLDDSLKSSQETKTEVIAKPTKEPKKSLEKTKKALKKSKVDKITTTKQTQLKPVKSKQRVAKEADKVSQTKTPKRVKVKEVG